MNHSRRWYWPNYVLRVQLFAWAMTHWWLLIVASILLQAWGAHDDLLLLNWPLNLWRHRRYHLLLRYRNNLRNWWRPYHGRVLRLRFLSHLRVNYRLLFEKSLRRSKELNWGRVLHQRRCSVDVNDGFLRLLLHRGLRRAADWRENDCIVVRNHLHRVRIIRLLSLYYGLLRCRWRFVDRRTSTVDHLVENILLRLSRVRNVVSWWLVEWHFWLWRLNNGYIVKSLKIYIFKKLIFKTQRNLVINFIEMVFFTSLAIS